jgi:hypothetical protein
MTENLKGSHGIPKITRHLTGGTAFDKVRPESLVHAVFGMLRLQKEVLALA